MWGSYTGHQTYIRLHTATDLGRFRIRSRNQRTNPNPDLIPDSESCVVESDLELESCRFESESDSYGQFHVTTDTTQKNKSSYAEYLVLVLYCTHITCHGFKGNIQIQLNNYEISPFEQLCEKLPFFTLKITHSLAPIIMKYYIIWRTALDLLLV